MTHTTTYEQIGRLLALQAEARVMSDIPETEQEAQAAIEKLESLARGRAELMRLVYESTGTARMLRQRCVT